MDDDNFGFSEKIINEMNNVLNSKIVDLELFEIVPVLEIVQNKCPVILVHNQLGLESWCVKHVYLYCYNQIFDNYIKKHKGKPVKITSLNSERLVRLLNVALLINPEVATFWNKRRELVGKSFLCKHDEVKFTTLVLSWKGKCNEAFSYRRWILEEMSKDGRYYVKYLTNDDLNVCYTASCKHPNNYHSWNHRMWVLNTVMKHHLHCADKLIKDEYIFSGGWISNHISDFSGFHYRQFCIKSLLTLTQIDINLLGIKKDLANLVYRHGLGNNINQVTDESLNNTDEKFVTSMLQDRPSCYCTSNYQKIQREIQVLLYELQMNNEMINFYKGHEALWYYRRFVIDSLLSIICDYYGVECQNGMLFEKNCRQCNSTNSYSLSARRKHVYNCSLYSVLIPLEVKFMNDTLVLSDQFAVKHDKYLKLRHGWIFPKNNNV